MVEFVAPVRLTVKRVKKRKKIVRRDAEDVVLWREAQAKRECAAESEAFEGKPEGPRGAPLTTSEFDPILNRNGTR